MKMLFRSSCYCPASARRARHSNSRIFCSFTQTTKGMMRCRLSSTNRATVGDSPVQDQPGSPAAGGVRSGTLFVVNSLCAPAGGKPDRTLQHFNGIASNSGRFPQTRDTRTLLARQYVTAYIGKWHMTVSASDPASTTTPHLLHTHGI